jgi:predicted nucleotide-binding protein
MAKRKSAPGTPPDLEPARALELLRRQLEDGQRLLGLGVIPSDEFTQWRNTTSEFIRRAFGSTSSNVETFANAGDAVFWQTGMDQSYYDKLDKDSLTGKIAILKSCIDQLEAVTTQPSQSQTVRSSNGQVFLVHGRNEGIRETVARFLESLGLPVTILHEQPNRGRTIIEKFEAYADVGFAVVLLTGDDRGGLASDPPKGYRPRARQNVILELGFFLGKIGRDLVCALYEPGVEIPSDFSGVLFVELDPNRRWHLELARELKAAGFDVDLNKLVR